MTSMLKFTLKYLFQNNNYKNYVKPNQTHP